VTLQPKIWSIEQKRNMNNDDTSTPLERIVPTTTGRAPMVARGVSVEKKFAPAPTNYVAGLGRGATGFTTRSDIGPARAPSAPPVANFGQAPEGYIPGAGRGAIGFGLHGTLAPGTTAPPRTEDDADKGDYSDAQFDKWSGFDGGGLFNGEAYDAEDRESDRIWDEVDKRMDSRRQKRREIKEQAALEKYRNERPKIQTQFADLKRDLSQISADEWGSIPEIGDYRIKKAKYDKFTPLPENILLSNVQNNIATTTQEDGGKSSLTDLRAISELKGILVKNQLQKAEDDVAGKTTINSKEYMNGMQTMNVLGEAEVGDYRKARELLINSTQSNPTQSLGWIALARVEELAGKVKGSRQAILRACEFCPESEDVWLEAIRLHPPKDSKSLVARAVQHLPQSVNIWLAAAELEETQKAKRKVLQKALLTIPNSVKLWKEAVELEDEEENAKVLLARAVECIPAAQSVELWLALARLETYQNAKKVLNKARKEIPTEPLIWITAAELEEANGNAQVIEVLLKNAIKSLSLNSVDINREDWLKKYAYMCEERRQLETCRSIVKNVMTIGVEVADRKHTWIEDATQAANTKHIETARAIYAYALNEFPQKKGLWRRAAQLEKKHGTKQQLLDLLAKAVTFCPTAEEFWLMQAKELWLSGDVEKARRVLADAFSSNQQNEEIWLAAVKLESENKEFAKARGLLEKARQQANTSRVWMKSAVFERNLALTGQTQDRTAEKQVLDQALKTLAPQDEDDSDYAKLWILRGQYEEQVTKNYKEARDIYERGLVKCPKSVPLWLCAAKLELELLDNVSKARALLEKARITIGQTHPNRGEIWRAAIRVENYVHFQANRNRTGIISITDVVSNMGQTMLAKALQDCPRSGEIWAISIDMEPRSKQRTQGVRALESCDKDANVIASVAKLFWKDRKLDKARPWLHRALALDTDNGDNWILAYRYEMEHGSEESRKEIRDKCEQVDPHHGELWCSLRKGKFLEIKQSVGETLAYAASELDINSYASLYTISTYAGPQKQT
jgi:pre-mRNA-processing factor 6